MASDYSDFDRFCDEHEIKAGEEPAAFAAWLHELSGGQWDGDAAPVGEQPEGLATGTELKLMVEASPAAQRGQSDRQRLADTRREMRSTANEPPF